MDGIILGLIINVAEYPTDVEMKEGFFVDLDPTGSNCFSGGVVNVFLYLRLWAQPLASFIVARWF